MRKPGVQKPHCSAASSRKTCCNGCSLEPRAKPSTVSMTASWACTASMRQEFTGLPLTITVHAPQLPFPQPSLVPVRCSSSRNTSSSVWRGSARNSHSCPLITARTTTLPSIGLSSPQIFHVGPCPLERGQQSAAHKHRHQMPPILRATANVRDGPGCVDCQATRLVDHVPRDLFPDERRLSFRSPHRRRRDGSQRDAGVGDAAALRIPTYPRPDADHRDV